MSQIKVTSMQPVLIGINEAREYIGVGNTFLYDLLAKREIKAVKAGKRTLIVVESLNQWIASLPEAKLQDKA